MYRYVLFTLICCTVIFGILSGFASAENFINSTWLEEKLKAQREDRHCVQTQSAPASWGICSTAPPDQARHKNFLRTAIPTVFHALPDPTARRVLSLAE